MYASVIDNSLKLDTPAPMNVLHTCAVYCTMYMPLIFNQTLASFPYPVSSGRCENCQHPDWRLPLSPKLASNALAMIHILLRCPFNIRCKEKFNVSGTNQ